MSQAPIGSATSSLMNSFDPFALHAFTSGAASPPLTSSTMSRLPSSTSTNTTMSSPPISPVEGHAYGLGSASHPIAASSSASIPSTSTAPGFPARGGSSLGTSSSYNAHLHRAMNAANGAQGQSSPSSFPSDSPLGSSSDSASLAAASAGSYGAYPASSSSSSPFSPTSASTTYSSPRSFSAGYAYSSNAARSGDAHVFTDFRSEIERQRRSAPLEDLPVLKKRTRAYDGF